MTAIAEIEITASADDAREKANGANFNSAVINLVASSHTAVGDRWNSGMRFASVPIPSGATVDTATVTVYLTSTSFDDPNCEIYAEDVDDAVDFSTDPDVTSRVRTTALATWTDTGLGIGDEVSVDIASVLQEIIDRGGWASGQDIVILFIGKSDIVSPFQFAAGDHADQSGPRLNATYTEAEPPVNPDPVVAAPQRNRLATARSDAGISMSAFRPSFTAGGAYTPDAVWQGRYGREVAGWSHDIAAVGGYWKAKFDFPTNRLDAESWLENGLLRHIECYSHQQRKVWEGFVNKVSIRVGPLSMSFGPLMDVGNRVSVVYTPILDPTANPPLTGVPQPTVIAENSASQAMYAIIERVLSGGTIQDADAELVRDVWLEENGLPTVSTSFDPGGDGVRVSIECLGYAHWLNAYVYNQVATSTTTTVGAKMQAILAADPNSIISADYGEMADNAELVPSFENENEFAWGIIKKLLGFGDSGDNRYLFGVYDNRVARYEVMPTDIAYHRSLTDQAQNVYESDGEVPVFPWDVRPGRWLQYTDLMPGRTQSSVFRDDPRNEFIESVTFTAPYTVNIQGSKVARLPQILARLGLGSI